MIWLKFIVVTVPGLQKMDKLVSKSPTLFTVVAQDEVSKTYEFPKRLISIRSSIMQRELTEEQKRAAGERFAKARQSKKQTAE